MQQGDHAETASQFSASAGLRLFQPKDPHVALGLAVTHLMVKSVYANLRFGDWSRILVGQINRRHYCFALYEHNQVQGFLGWALSTRDKAEAWLTGRSGHPMRIAERGIASSSMPGQQTLSRSGACCGMQRAESAAASRQSISNVTTRTALSGQCGSTRARSPGSAPDRAVSPLRLRGACPAA